MEEQPKNLPFEIVQVCKVAPSPCPPAEFSLPLTYFDLQFFRVLPTGRILYYSFAAANEPQLDSILQNLKHSLSLALSHFLPLAGNLVWPHHSPEPFILYKPGDSVSLTIAKTDADFNHLSAHYHLRKANESQFLLPELQISDTTVAPAMRLQITLFPNNKGLSIGITTNHVVVDGKTSTMFLKSWASICTRLHNNNNNLPPTYLPPELTPVFDRTEATNDPNGLQKLYLKYFGIFIPNPKMVTFPPQVEITDDVVSGTFELTRADVENLRRKVAATSTTRRLTTFVMAFAHVSICMVKALRIIEPKVKIGLSFLVDWRPRVGTLGGSNYFGNGITGYPVFFEAMEFEEENALTIVSNKICDGIAEIEERVANDNKLVEMLEINLGRFGKEVPLSKLITVGGSPRFGVYDIDFGWGANCEKVEMALRIPTETFSMAESRNGDGVQVEMALPREAMNIFCSLFSERSAKLC